MAKFLNYLFTGDDRIPPPVPLPIDDDSSDWWGGVAKNFASVAIATAVAANALAAQLPYASQWQQDEVPTPPPTVVAEEDSWIPPVAPIFKYEIPKAFSDDEVLPAHAFELEPWIPPVPPLPPLVQPFTDQDEIPAGSLFGQYDEDFWSNPTAPVPALLRIPNPWDWEQNEQAVLWGVPVETEWIQLVKPDNWQSTKVFSDDDVIVFTTPVIIEEDLWSNPTAPVPATLQYPNPWVWEQNEQAVLRGVPVETEWTRPVVWPIPDSPKVFSFNDEIAQAPVTAVFESDWQVFKPQNLQWQSQVFSATDEIERTRVEESDWNVPVIQQSQRSVQAFISDEDFVPVVQDYGESFIFVPPQYQPVVQAFASDDDFIGTVAPPIVEDEAGWINKPMVLYAPPPIIFNYNDENPFDEFPGEPPPFSQRGCCNISGTTVTFSGCDEGAPVVFDDCACPS